MKKHILLAFGFLCVGLGIIGVFLPIMPTTPFMLVAAICFSSSSEKFHSWLINHPTFGEPIRRWQVRGAIHPKHKALCVIFLIAGFIWTIFMPLPMWFRIMHIAIVLAVTVFVLSRPNS